MVRPIVVLRSSEHFPAKNSLCFSSSPFNFTNLTSAAQWPFRRCVVNFKVLCATLFMLGAGVSPAIAGSKIIINQYGDYNSAVAIQDQSAHVGGAGKRGNAFGRHKQKKKVIINQYGTGNSAAAAQ